MIDNLKDLEKLLKLCRKQGVFEIKLGSIELKLGELPAENGQAVSDDIENPLKNFPQGELTSTQLIFYSSGGLPEDDPELKAG